MPFRIEMFSATHVVESPDSFAAGNEKAAFIEGSEDTAHAQVAAEPD